MGDDAIVSWISVHLKQLGQMFGDEGLTRLRGRSPRHPAVALYEVLLAMEAHDGGDVHVGEAVPIGEAEVLARDVGQRAAKPPAPG